MIRCGKIQNNKRVKHKLDTVLIQWIDINGRWKVLSRNKVQESAWESIEIENV